MKKRLLMIVLGLLPMCLLAQNTQGFYDSSNWKITGITGINVSQTSLSNWASGGENNFAGNIYLNASANYKLDKWSWDNTLATDFGQSFSESNKWQTVVDKLNLNSKLGYELSEHWNIAGMLDFLTQYSKGYKSAAIKNATPENYISKFFAPAYLTLALGADYRPCEYFSALISPVTGKMTFVLDKKLSDAGAFGVSPGKNLLAEIGASITANANMPLYENISLQSKLMLFSAYNHNFGNVDVYWDVMLAAKINKYFATTLTTNLIYDDDIKIADKAGNNAHPRVQFREILGLGLSYAF